MSISTIRKRRLAGACLLLMLASTAAQPTLAAEEPTRPVVVVSGNGEAQAAPDMAIISLGVQQAAASAREAVSATNAAMDQVLKALKDGGIADRDMQTSGFSITPQYTYFDNSNGENRPPQLTGYQAYNGLTIRLRDIARLGEVLDRTVSLGINQGGNIQFSNDNPEAAMTEARKRAVADAMAKAKVLAEAAGVPLGRVLEIAESTAQPVPMPIAARAFAKDSAAESVPIAAGENTYAVTVTMRFEIGG